ncbi:hypothetical protein BIV03_01045 [Curtobacterium sp. MCBA15_016]|uniref:hypothetical protein n=1 Tax=Curtobacterium sp. MCBA15_016 TaxID=1898740 RepID=UPI0008DE6C43|nr:hypothetical protein [Curtobacterium sp. MCBA15_016]OII28867.1 hypothetical protein BIV03_01045 [Curtobacterium sp. MCBA15_016]
MNAAAGDRFFAFAYERLLTSTIQFVDHGRRGDALDRAHESASPRMAASYRSVAQGLTQILHDQDVVTARRQQRNVVVMDPDTGDSLVSLRLHLILTPQHGPAIGTHVYFPEQALAPVERSVMETAVALATEQADPTLSPGIALARAGTMVLVGNEALSTDRLEMLRAVSRDYVDQWDTQE